MAARTLSLVAALLLTCTTASALTNYYMKNNNQEVLYGMEARAGTTGFAVFVDPDDSNESGFVTKTIGADFKVTNEGVFQHTGGDSWSKVADAAVTQTSFTVDGVEHVRWEAIVQRSVIGELEECQEQTALVFQAGTHLTHRIVHRFTPGNKDCYPSIVVKTTSTVSDVSFTMASHGSWEEYRVYIDGDLDPNTGLAKDDGFMGAELRLTTDGKLAQFNGGWTDVATVTYVVEPRWGTRTWTVSRSLLGDAAGCENDAVATYEAEGGSPTFLLTTVARLSSSTSCYKQVVAVPFGADPCGETICGTSEVSTDMLKGGLGVVNILDRAPLPESRITNAQAANLAVLGYVPLAFGDRAPESVQADIDLYFATYPTISGILFDELYSDDCAQNGLMCYYKNYVKSKGSIMSIVAANPGVTPPMCYMDCVDVMMNVDTTASEYLSNSPMPDWVFKFPSTRFFHLVAAPDTSLTAAIVAKSSERHAANVFVRNSTSTANKWNELIPGRNAEYYVLGDAIQSDIMSTISNARRRRYRRR